MTTEFQKFSVALIARAILSLTISTAPGQALAGILVNVDFVTRNFSIPDTALTGFTAFQVDVHTDDGALISAVDVKFDGLMHQRWNPGIDCSTPDGQCPSPRGLPADGRGDSHLTPPTNALFGAAPLEDNPGNGSPLPSGLFHYGVGHALSGAWGIAGSSQTTGTSIAYLVIPDGHSVQFDWAIATTGTTGETFRGSTVIVVPEPSGLCMLLSFGLITKLLIGHRSIFPQGPC